MKRHCSALVLLLCGLLTVGLAKVTVDYAVVGFERTTLHAELIDAQRKSTEIEATLRNFPGHRECNAEKLTVELASWWGPDVLY